MAPRVPAKNVEKIDWKKVKETRKIEKELRKLKREAKLNQDDKVAESEVSQSNSKEKIFRCLDRPTLSIALPSSILENAQSQELKTYLGGQIARAASIFKVDEVVVFDDVGTCEPTNIAFQIKPEENGEQREPIRRSCIQMARILQYLECPQYLRRFFFPIHRDLQYAGLLNPLDTPHHLRQSDDFPFREGMVTTQQLKAGHNSRVNVGLARDVQVDRLLEPGLRVTVQLLPLKEGSKKRQGRIVTPQTPEATTGRYWGYSVRIASSLGTVFSQSPYAGGYDLTIGTSDKGQRVDELATSGSLPSYQHALVVFGGLAGLEGALEADPVLQEDNPALLFDQYLNTCPDQGSRTIRTEEAVLITLAALRTHLKQGSTTANQNGT